jgi:fatty acid desaturase
MSNPIPLPPRLVRTVPRDSGASTTSTYSALLRRVKEAGLLDRRTGYYWRVFAVLAAAFVGCWAAFAVLGDTWWQLLVAAALGVVFTQFAFLSHEAGHNQVFASRRWNENAARYGGVLLAGISYAWWMNKHTRHHGNPNTVGKDPDISFEAISFRPEDAARKRGLLRVLVRVQGYAFFPMLLLEGVNLHWQAVRTFVSGEDVKGRWFEAGVFTARFVVYFGVLFWFLPLGTAFAFIGVQMAVFGLYMGISFAPNHKGMPVIEHDQKVDFLSRQVLTSRNISGGRFVTHFMGGLNHQVEHHLFPNMARPNLRAAKVLVQEHCAALGVPYTETTMFRSYGIVVRYLNRVGLAARDPFACPMVEQFRVR